MKAPAPPPRSTASSSTGFFEAFHGSAVARSTETWNAVHAAKEDLKRRLAAFVADRGASNLED